MSISIIGQLLVLVVVILIASVNCLSYVFNREGSKRTRDEVGVSLNVGKHQENFNSDFLLR